MIFLNPSVLFALAAASLPVIFHFFARRRAKRVVFSSVQFLKELEKNSMKKIKIQEILLLIIRTLLIIFIVLAFSRPALEGYRGGIPGTSAANTTMVMLLDNSGSMSRRIAGTTRYQYVLETVDNLTKLLKENDEVYIIPLVSAAADHTPLRSRSEIMSAAASVTLSDASASIESALKKASSILAQSSNINKEIVIISDDQRINYQFSDTVMTDSLRLALFDERTRLYSVNVGGDNDRSGNLAIDSMSILTTIFETDRPIEFACFIRNSSQGDIDGRTVSLFFNSQRVAQKSIGKIAAGESRRILISAPFRSTGSIGVEASLEDDPLLFDNHRYCSIRIPDTRRVLFFFPNPSDIEYMRLALSQSLSTTEKIRYQLEYHRIEELRMLPTLGDIDAVIVGIGSLLPQEQDIAALQNYLKKNKAATVFLMDGIDIGKYNTAVASQLGLPEITNMYSAPAGKYSSFTDLDLAHPFFTGMFEDKSAAKGIESPKFRSFYYVRQNGIPIISLSSGGMFLSEQKAMSGTVLLFTSAPTLTQSDLPLKSIFLPLLHRTVSYTAALTKNDGDELQQQVLTNEQISLDLPGDRFTIGGAVFVLGPDGFAERIQIGRTADGRPSIVLPPLNNAGLYRISESPDARPDDLVIAVNPDTKESRMDIASHDEMSRYFERLLPKNTPTIMFIDAEKENAAAIINDSRFGVELWQLITIAALLCAVAEMLIARVPKNP